MILVTYDVSVTSPLGQSRLRKVAKYCQNHGIRVQNSVFECVVEPSVYEKMKNDLTRIIDKKTDSLRFYMMGKNWEKHIVHIGAKSSINIQSDSIIL